MTARQLVIVDGEGVAIAEAAGLSADRIGHKAAGLCRLPTEWVPPFFVVTAGDVPNVDLVADAARSSGIPQGAKVYVRSSGTVEGIEERGSLPSEVASLAEVPETLRRLSASVASRLVASSRVHWIVQAWVRPRAKGHLSNERRISQVARDWIAEIEPSNGALSESAPVAVRRWRNARITEHAIACDLRAKIPRALQSVALWCGTKRAHLEWVWDGDRVWVVQMDDVQRVVGIRPQSLVSSAPRLAINTQGLNVFRTATTDDLNAYRKLGNARLYTSLNYKLPDFYVLDDVQELRNIQQGGAVSDALRSDLERLCVAPFVLRTDGRNLPNGERQMLPRSDELRSIADALTWLSGKFAQGIRTVDLPGTQLALIGHHFIPAAASAWCLAYPDQRRVRIESLWGIPEGLYYYPHDVFDVDTGHQDASSARVGDARIVAKKVRHKGKFIAPDATGKWVVHTVSEGPDWAQSIAKPESIQEIAVVSRQIAQAMNHPTVVMWFIDMPPHHCQHHVLPWYHEEWTTEQSESLRNARKLGRAHGVRVLRNGRDLDQLLKDTASGMPVAYIAVEPEDGEIVRERRFIERLAQDAKLRGYEVQLRGGVLSHVFYALAREGCTVSCIDLFESEDELVEFNKLVRDEVPAAIAGKGELVEVVQLRGEALLSSLKRKLLEEALEVSAAFDTDAVSDEIADVLEVVDSIINALGIDQADVARRKRAKKKKRGGFSQGLMLCRTHLAPLEGDTEAGNSSRRSIAQVQELPTTAPTLHVDRRTSPFGVMEGQLTLDVSLSHLNGAAKGYLELPTSGGEVHSMRVDVKSAHRGSNLRVRVRLINEAIQLSLFEHD